MPYPKRLFRFYIFYLVKTGGDIFFLDIYVPSSDEIGSKVDQLTSLWWFRPKEKEISFSESGIHPSYHRCRCNGASRIHWFGITTHNERFTTSSQGWVVGRNSRSTPSSTPFQSPFRPSYLVVKPFLDVAGLEDFFFPSSKKGSKSGTKKVFPAGTWCVDAKSIWGERRETQKAYLSSPGTYLPSKTWKKLLVLKPKLLTINIKFRKFCRLKFLSQSRNFLVGTV